MALIFTYTRQEWVKARREYMFLSKIITKLQLAGILLLWGVEVFLLATEGITILNVVFLLALLFSVAAIIYLLGIQPGYLFDHTPKYHQEYKLCFLEKEIRITAEGSAEKQSWDEYRTAYETKGFFYLVKEKQGYYAIPKRAFASKEEVQRFRKILKDRQIL